VTTLHIVRQSAFCTTDFAQCIQVLANNDVIVFIDDGCYNLKHHLIDDIENSKNIQLKVIEQHARARAVVVDTSVFVNITIEGLVKLTFENNRVITWQ